MKRTKKGQKSLSLYFKIFIFSFFLLCIISILLIANLFFEKNGGNEIEIPSFVGKSEDEIYDIDGVITIKDYVYCDTVNKGRVIYQSYSGRTKVSRDRLFTLNITVSLGNDTVSVPNMAGMDIKNAQKLIKNIGARVDIQYIYGDYDNNMVLYHLPKKDTNIKKGGSITLYVSRSSENQSVKVPEFEGMDITCAISLARENNITIGNIEYVYTEDMPDGYVVAQSIPSGSIVKTNSKINFKVAKSTNYNTKDKKESRVKLWMDKRREE